MVVTDMTSHALTDFNVRECGCEDAVANNLKGYNESVGDGRGQSLSKGA